MILKKLSYVLNFKKKYSIFKFMFYKFIIYGKYVKSSLDYIIFDSKTIIVYHSVKRYHICHKSHVFSCDKQPLSIGSLRRA